VVRLLRGTVAGGIVAGLVCNGLAWWDLSTVLRWQGFRTAVGVVEGLACCGRTCAPHWGGAMVRFSWGRLVSKSGLHAMLGRHRSSVTVSLAHCDRVVAVDLRVAKGGGGGHDLRAEGGGGSGRDL